MSHASKALLVALIATPALAGASLDKDLIRGRIRAHNGEYRACYEQALKKDPKLAGKVVVKFVVGKDGTVIESEGKGLPPVDACVAKVIAKIEFPKNERGSFSVSYPFLFQPGTSGRSSGS